MPLTRRLAPNVLYAECNSPTAPGADDPLPWDTFYDQGQNVIAGAALTAALAAIGLTLAANVFTATRAGVFTAVLSFGAIVASVAQSNQVRIISPGYIADPRTGWGGAGSGSFLEENNPPPDGEQVLSMTFYMNAGDAFRARSIAQGTVTAGAIDYAAMSIARLV